MVREMHDQKQKIKAALDAPQPGDHLFHLATAFKEKGLTQAQIYSLFTDFLARHEEDEDETKYDALIDVLDFISGYCHPSKALFKDDED